MSQHSNEISDETLMAEIDKMEAFDISFNFSDCSWDSGEWLLSPPMTNNNNNNNNNNGDDNGCNIKHKDKIEDNNGESNKEERKTIITKTNRKTKIKK